MNKPLVHNACRTVAVSPWHTAERSWWDAQNVLIVENVALLKEFWLDTNMLKSPLGRLRKFVGNDGEWNKN